MNPQGIVLAAKKQERSTSCACSACAAENKRLNDIIRRASVKFCEDGPDGTIAAEMFSILAEAEQTGKPL